IEQMLGLELNQNHYDKGTAFVTGVLDRADKDGLARLWNSARELPTPAEVEAPGLWLARIDLPD
ncbi:MAG: zinc-dependent metalloprotease, partial [bacterium]|nr:zinc-dependent metalloprotease [bacterium]